MWGADMVYGPLKEASCSAHSFAEGSGRARDAAQSVQRSDTVPAQSVQRSDTVRTAAGSGSGTS
eukprot:6275567-Pyramimonas_sp.AAC.1